MVAQNLTVRLTYGMGGSCQALLPRHAVLGLSARQLIGVASERVEGNGTQHRVAGVLADLIRRQISIDILVSKRPGSAQTHDRPVGPDQVVVSADEDTCLDVEEIDMLVSEPYRGGFSS